MEKEELKVGDFATLSEDKTGISKGKIWAKRGEKVEIKSIHHFPVIIVEGITDSFSVMANKLIKIEPKKPKQP
jgi:hypothetical protein